MLPIRPHSHRIGLSVPHIVFGGDDKCVAFLRRTVWVCAGDNESFLGVCGGSV